MAYTEAQLKDAARKALAAGDTAAAKRLIDAARAAAAPAVAAQAANPMAERIAAAKAGTLKLQPGSAERAAAADAQAMGQMQQPSTLADMAKAGGAGLARGAVSILGIPGTLSDVMDIPAKKLGLLRQDAPGSMLSAESLVTDLGKMTGGATDYQAQTTPGEYAQTVGEFIPGAMIGGGGVGSALRYGVVPGLASEAAGQATEGTAYEPYARAAAAIAAPIAGAALGKGARALVSPYGGVDPERLKLAKVLQDYGVPVTAGQKTGAEGLRRAEGATSAGQAVMEQQADDFTKAALKAIGTDANRATPEVLTQTASRIGKVFDDVLTGVDVTPDAKAITDLSKAMAVYRDLAPKATSVPLLENINKAMFRAFRTGDTVPASTMATWRSSLSKLSTSPDTATREAAIAALDAIDNSMSATLTTAGRAADVARLSEARGQWRDFLAIQKAASRAGEERALGIISPSALRNELALQSRTAMARGGRGDIGNLARAGEAVMKPLPTVAPGAVRNIPGMSSILGGMAGSYMGGPVGAAVGMAAPAAMAMAKMTRPMQAYLGNQLVSPGGPLLSPEILRTIPGLLAQ